MENPRIKVKCDRDDKMSDSDSSKSDLDKDDEDFLIKLEASKSKSDKESDKEKKDGKTTPEKTAKKSLDLTDISKPIISLFHKHKRSFDSDNNSIESIDKKTGKRKKKELTAFQKSFIASQKEEFEKNFKILKEDFKFLEEYEQKIFKDTNLDLMFIMDLTGSMGIWLDEAKKSIQDIIEEITENNPGSKIRLSFVGYKDFTIAGEKREYSSKEFSENIKEITDYINTLGCSGGGDIPEDIVGALKHALSMKWESDAKYAILVCDAPCHGKQYHNISYDRFANGDPDGTTLESVIDQFRQNGITLYCLEIDSSTEKMFNIMKNVYNNDKKFHIEKLWNSSDFSFFVSFSASMVLGNEKYAKFKFKDIITNYRREKIELILKKYVDNNININNNDILNNNNNAMDLINQIENLQLGGEDKKLFDFINRMNDLNIDNDKNNNGINMKNDDDINNSVQIQLNKELINTFFERRINYTIRGIIYNKNNNSINDWMNPTIQELEFKTNIYLLNNTYNEDYKNKEYNLSIFDNILDKEKKGIIPFTINNIYYNNTKEYLRKLYYEELIASQIGDYFNILMKEKLTCCNQFIKFPRHVIYELNINEKNQDCENLITEEFQKNLRYIISEDTIKFNLSFKMENRNLQSFSHFSYQITGGQILITDFEYDDEYKKVTKFKIYNTKTGGYKNILEFFSSHICNNTCKTLNLIHPRKKSELIIDEEFWSQKYLTDVKLCECCEVPIFLDNIKNREQSKCCDICECKEIATKYKEICTKCLNVFYYSTHVSNCNLRKYPEYCEKCTNIFNF